MPIHSHLNLRSAATGALRESFDSSTSNYINANENISISKKDIVYASGNSKGANVNGNHIAFGIPHMQQLFEEQRKYLNYFFSNVEYSEVQAFEQVLIDAKEVIFFTGVVKSGFVAQKISQTFVSTGTKAVFLSPIDALHGDIGIVGSNDVLVLFSKSGTTEELLRLVPCARAKGAYLVGITNLKNSQLGNACGIHVHLPLERELCPFDLAPVTSIR